jgi:hypothetical protein
METRQKGGDDHSGGEEVATAMHGAAVLGRRVARPWAAGMTKRG